MIDPKEFFRKLDVVLTKIAVDKTGKDFLYSIVTALEQIFSGDTHISRGRIYEEGEGEFILVDPPSNGGGADIKKTLPIDTDAMKYLLEHGTYIYDDPVLSIDRGISRQMDYAIPAAIVVKSPDERWIFVFELKSGWIREEVEFILNAVRTMLEYRLTSEAVRGEMQRAADIQRSLLPASAPEIPGYDIYGRSQSAELVGGDFYDYFRFDDEIFGVAIGDASGHGLPAALLVRDVVTGLRMALEKNMKMAYTIKKLNKVIYRSTYSSGFISVFYGELEKNGNFIFVNAGHPAPILLHQGAFHALEANGLIIGALPEIAISRSYASIAPGSVLVAYSDGILERENRMGRQFGLERLKKIVLQHQTKSAKEIVEAIYHKVYLFGASQKWSDDATVVVIKRLKTK